MTTHGNWAWIDNVIVLVYIVITVGIGFWMKRFAGRLENFIVAGRNVNIYLGIASLAATEFGLLMVMVAAQGGYTKGFSVIFLGVAAGVIMLAMGWTGFVVKKLRATGAVTIPEILEKKYGSRVRWWSGVFVATGGILNMGVFLRIAGEFVVYFIGMGEGAVEIMGFRLGYLELIMTAMLALTLLYTSAGGMLSILVTDLAQFLLMGIGVVWMTLMCVSKFGWFTLVDKVRTVHGPGGFNPFLSEGYGPWYVLYIFLFMFVGQATWQTQISRLLSAKDERTAAKMYSWAGFYFIGRWALPAVWGITALLIVDPALFPVNDKVDASRLATPTALGMITPSGLAGLIMASMLAAEMSSISSYLLSWATVIVHDIVKPMRRNGLEPKAELFWTRVAVVAIGVFLVFFGLWYKLEGMVWDFLATTGSIYMSAMGALLIAGLYWKRAHRTGAYAALFLGAFFPLSCLTYNQLVAREILHTAKIPEYLSGLASLTAAALGMVIGSLLGGKKVDPSAPDNRIGSPESLVRS